MDTTNKTRTLKGGEFLVKETPCEDIFIPNDFNEESRMMAEAAKEFIDREVWPNKDRFEKKDYKFTEEIMKQFGEMGFLGVGVPEQFGGLGMDFNTNMLVCDYLSGATGSLATAYGAHTGIGTLPILLYGNDEQRNKYLPRLASGEWMSSYALTEPGAGSDANSGKTKAVLTEDGEHYLISGQKMWISNAGFTDLFIVFARIEEDKNITAFIVDYDPENPNGITLGEEEHKLGIRASSTRQVFFNDTKVHLSQMLSERGNGFKIAMNALNVGRIKLAVASLDAQRRMTSLAVKYANERHQFKRPISSFGAIQSKLADMATSAYSAEAGTYRAGQDIENEIKRLEERGETPQNSKLKGVEEYAVEASIMKVYASEAVQYVSDETIQIYGGMGFSEETPAESAWRDARITRIYEGTNEINRMLIVGMLLKKAMKGKIDLMGPAMKVADELMSIPSFDVPDQSALFAPEKEMIQKLKKAILMVAGQAVQKFGMELDQQQELLMSLADMIIETYVAESTVLRSEKLALQKGEEAVAAQINMAKLNLYKAVEKVGQRGREAVISFTEGDEQVMMMMGIKRFTKYRQYPNVTALKRSIAEGLIEANTYNFYL